MSRIYLSPPDTGLADQAAINRAFEGGWIAPLGPEVDAFEAELATATDRSHGVALSSGTAALHLALLLLGVGPEDRVLVSRSGVPSDGPMVVPVGADQIGQHFGIPRV